MRLSSSIKDYPFKSIDYYSRLKEIRREFTMKYKVTIRSHIDSLL